jgi:hypothetical protein
MTCNLAGLLATWEIAATLARSAADRKRLDMVIIKIPGEPAPPCQRQTRLLGRKAASTTRVLRDGLSSCDLLPDASEGCETLLLGRALSEQGESTEAMAVSGLRCREAKRISWTGTIFGTTGEPLRAARLFGAADSV